jgi:hypothetical protein
LKRNSLSGAGAGAANSKDKNNFEVSIYNLNPESSQIVLEFTVM